MPGATLWHEGQFEGRRVRPPVFRPAARTRLVNAELAEWYRRLLAAVDQDRVRDGQWRLLEIEGWPDNQSCHNLLAWLWSGEEGVDGHFVVINLSEQPAQGRVRLDWPRLEGRSWQLVDLVQDVSFDRDGTETSAGLFVDLGARGSSTCSRFGHQAVWLRNRSGRPDGRNRAGIDGVPEAGTPKLASRVRSSP